MTSYGWKNMKNLIVPALLLALLTAYGTQTSPAQNSDSIQQEVVKKLTEIKPPDTKDFKYKIVPAAKIEKLPDNLRLDIVYKIGHYEWSLVALRFEKEKGKPFVDVTQFTYSSALDFYKEWKTIGDSYSASHGQMAVKDFDRLLTLAYTLYNSDIKWELVPVNTSEKDSFASMLRIPSMGWSSGNGLIVLNLKSAESNPQTLIRDSGSLHAGDLKGRASLNFKFVRAHLFWEVFDDALEKQNIFRDLEKSKAEETAISSLEEPQMIDDFHDYFRQSLYVLVLSEIGTSKALPILESKSKTGGLEKDWDESLTRAAQYAIKKIKARS